MESIRDNRNREEVKYVERARTERQEFAADYGQLRHTALPIELGGTFGRTPEEALINLGVASASSLGGNGGVAKLAASGYIDLTTVPDDLQYLPTVYGDDTVLVGSTNEYRITNYDLNTPYTVTADHGTAVVEGDVVRFTAPATPASSGFTLNNEHTTVDVVYPSPLKPTILTPTDLSQNQAFSGLLVKSSAFKMLGGSDIHEMSDWELSRVSNFATIEQSSYADGINLTTWAPADLQSQTEYYVRARHKSVEHGWSPWGPAIKFKTKVDGVAGNVVAQGWTGVGGSAGFGYNVSMSGNGNVIAASSPADDRYGDNLGCAYVVRKTSSGWTNFIALSHPGRGSMYSGASVTLGGVILGMDLGSGGVELNTDGDVVVVGGPQNDSRNPNASTSYGMVGYYWWNGSNYNLLPLYTNLQQPGQYAGAGVSVTGDGQYVAIGIPMCTPSGYATKSGAVEIIKILTTAQGGKTWRSSDTKTIYSPVSAASHYFGAKCKFSTDGSLLVVTALNYSAGSATANGDVYIYRRNELGDYVHEASFGCPADAIDFGWILSISEDNSTVGIGAVGGAYTSVGPKCSVYIARYKSGSWVIEATIVSPDVVPTTQYMFGKSICLSPNGNVAYIGNPYLDLSVKNNYGYVGGVYVFKRSATGTWSKSGIIYLPGMPNLMRFGWSIDTNAKGDTLVVSSINANMGSGDRQGTVHILQ